MKIKQSLIISTGISVLSFLLALSPQENASAAFSCGPHLKTYKVSAANGSSGQGIRCVRFNLVDLTGRPSTIIWYGEGYWGSAKYRHIGEGYFSQSDSLGLGILVESNTGTATASDIYGNGESTSGTFPNNLRLTAERPFSFVPQIPRRIRITGAWNEIWTLESDNVVESYTSTLSPVRTCGPHLEHMKVRDNTGRRTGGGIRCALMPGSTSAWYGEGNWNGFTYAHIGIGARGHFNGGPGAYDICEPSKFRICNSFPQGSINIDPVPSRPYPACRGVTGAWNEIWGLIVDWTEFDGRYQPRPPLERCPA